MNVKLDVSLSLGSLGICVGVAILTAAMTKAIINEKNTMTKLKRAIEKRTEELRNEIEKNIEEVSRMN